MTGPVRPGAETPVSAAVPDIESLKQRLEAVDYLADGGLATALFLSLRLPQPLLLEGEAGVGKTEAAKALAAALGTELIRLQCYEGIDSSEALYEWNYPRQLLRKPQHLLGKYRLPQTHLECPRPQHLASFPQLTALRGHSPVHSTMITGGAPRHMCRSAA